MQTIWALCRGGRALRGSIWEINAAWVSGSDYPGLQQVKVHGANPEANL
jgi:hypothetical protein